MKKYFKNGKECILCHSRKKLIQITPEEIVRQEFIQKLINQYRVPADLIEAEVPLSYYKKGKRGRVDILVSSIDKREESKYPLIVVECKAPNIAITDKVFIQAWNYDKFLKPVIMILTNGSETICYTRMDTEDDYREVNYIPTFPELIGSDDLQLKEIEEFSWDRPNPHENKKENWTNLVDWGWMGEDSSEDLAPLIMNLSGLIYDQTDRLKKLNLNEKDFIKDGGLRYTSFGNAAGGDFTGEYRYFILENKNSETELASLSIVGKISTKNHPKWGNSNGHTLLNIAIDDMEYSHMSLEYAIDRFIKKKENIYEFWHDGTLTLGKKGRVKNSEIMQYVKENAPYLIKNNRIFLGEIDNSKILNWENEKARNLISNFIDYGFVRDDFRKTRR